MVVRAKDIMCEDVVTISPGASVMKAIERLLEANVSSLMVVDETSRMVGIVNESALIAATFDDHIRNHPVSLHMERNFVYVRPTDSLESVIDVSILHRVRHMPVLDNGRLVGLVSRRDMLRTIFGNHKPAMS